MISISKPLSIFYFCCGLIVGFLVGMSIDKQSSVIVTRVISAAGIILIALFWSKFESFAHKRYLETWPNHRSRGKWRFIFAHYVFVRGLVLFLVVAAPMLSMITLTAFTAAIIAASVLVLVALLVYLGHEEWTMCEQDFNVVVLRQAAEQSRVSAN